MSSLGFLQYYWISVFFISLFMSFFCIYNIRREVTALQQFFQHFFIYSQSFFACILSERLVIDTVLHSADVATVFDLLSYRIRNLLLVSVCAGLSPNADARSHANNGRRIAWTYPHLW